MPAPKATVEGGEPPEGLGCPPIEHLGAAFGEKGLWPLPSAGPSLCVSRRESMCVPPGWAWVGWSVCKPRSAAALPRGPNISCIFSVLGQGVEKIPRPVVTKTLVPEYQPTQP